MKSFNPDEDGSNYVGDEIDSNAKTKEGKILSKKMKASRSQREVGDQDYNFLCLGPTK